MKSLKLFIIALFLQLNLNFGFSQTLQNLEGKPNVLMIMVDDLSVIMYSDDIYTPNIDRLAKRGRNFNRAYAQSPVCNASRSSILTGKYPKDLKIWDNIPHFRGVDASIVTIPQHFKNNGYHSVGIGKIYHNWGQAIEGDPRSWSEPQIYHYATHFQDEYIPGRLYELHDDIPKGASVQNVKVPDEAYLDGRISNAAVNKLRELQETPFFLAVGFWKPHLPYNVPKKYWDLYDRNNLPPVTYSDPIQGVSELEYIDSNEARSYSDVNNSGPIPEPKKKELRHGYLAAISYVDAQIGKVLDELEILGLADNTIVLFLSDHGYHAGEHGQFGKWTQFEIGARVPFIISSPGMNYPGESSDNIIELVDVFPTLMDLCDLPLPKQSQFIKGKSLREELDNPDSLIFQNAYSQIARPISGPIEIVGSSLRNEKYRYNIWINHKSGEIIDEELYDLSNDPFFVQNVIEESKYSAVSNTLKKELLIWIYR